MVKGHYIMFFKRKKNGRFFLKFVLLFTIFKKGKKREEAMRVDRFNSIAPPLTDNNVINENDWPESIILV